MNLDDTYAVEAALSAACSIAIADVPARMLTAARSLVRSLLVEIILRENLDLDRTAATDMAVTMMGRLDGKGTYTRDEIRAEYEEGNGMIVKRETKNPGKCDICDDGDATHAAIARGATGRYCEVIWGCPECLNFAGDKVLSYSDAYAEIKRRGDGYPDF